MSLRLEELDEASKAFSVVLTGWTDVGDEIYCIFRNISLLFFPLWPLMVKQKLQDTTVKQKVEHVFDCSFIRCMSPSVWLLALLSFPSSSPLVL